MSDPFIPFVTVYIPTKNRSKLVCRAINSVINQTYSNIEIIVVNDGSTDDTEYCLKHFQHHSQFSSINLSTSQGACAARNLALKQARGEFITGLDDDDYFTQDRISSFIATWNKNPNFVGLYSDATVLKKKSDSILLKRPTRSNQSALLTSNTIGNQIFTKTEYLRSVGGFSPEFPAWQDLECWYRLLAKPGSEMLNTQIATYIFDTSHEQIRISDSAREKIYYCHQLFTEKHELSPKKASLLLTHIYEYFPKDMPFSYPAVFFTKTLRVKSTLRLIARRFRTGQ